METEVTDNFSFDAATRRVTLVAPDGIWALKFGTAAKYSDFVMEYNSTLFENTYGVENDEVNRGKVHIGQLYPLLYPAWARASQTPGLHSRLVGEPT